MKVVLVLALVALAYSAPQTRKLFHEHMDDFLELIQEEVGSELDHILEHYVDNEEFQVSIAYLETTKFRDLVYEMEALDEFKAVIEFLENDNIDILYFLDRFNEIIDGIQKLRRTKTNARHEVSGRDLSSFVSDCIEILPKEKLAALFDQKKEEDEEFRVAMDNLNSDEWQGLLDALWANEVFQQEVETLAENGIDVNIFLLEIKAIFGQN